MKLGIAAVAAGVVLVVGACGGGDAWPKSAGETSCGEWIADMSIDDRRGLASSMLKLLWEKDGAAEEPGEAVVLRFANAIGGTCTAWLDEKVSTVASSLYALADDVKPGSN